MCPAVTLTAMAWSSRVLRVALLVPVVLLRVTIAVACAGALYKIGALLDDKVFGGSLGRDSLYLLWSCVAIGAVAEQKLFHAIDWSDLKKRVVVQRTIRPPPAGHERADGDIWFDVGIFLQDSHIHECLLAFELDARGNPTVWNQEWIMHIWTPDDRDFSRATAIAGTAGLRLMSRRSCLLMSVIQDDRTFKG